MDVQDRQDMHIERGSESKISRLSCTSMLILLHLLPDTEAVENVVEKFLVINPAGDRAQGFESHSQS